METLEAIQSRKSIRSYQNKPVEQDKLDAILSAANSAPIAGELSMVLITCPNMLGPVNDAAKYTMLNGGNDFLKQRASLPGYEPLYGAPALILFCAPEGGYSQMNCANAATTAALAATDLGLGSCFMITPTLAFKPEYDMMQWLEIPEGHKPLCALALGYTDDPDLFGGAPKRDADNIAYILAGENCVDC